jgi:hypothetical protein
MVAPWDPTIPSGGENRSQGDDRIRELKEQLEEYFENEHYFGSGVADDHKLRHTFGVGSEADRDARITDTQEGMVWYRDDLVSHSGGIIELVEEVYALGAWKQLREGLLRVANTWHAPQLQIYFDLGPSVVGGQVSPDFGENTAFYIELAADLQINAPLNQPAAGTAGAFTFHFLQDLAGGHVVDLNPSSLWVMEFETYVFGGLTVPPIGLDAGDVTTMHCWYSYDQKIHCSLWRRNA